jgi:hypothetical protein
MATCLGIELTQDVRPPVTDPTLSIPVELPECSPDWAHRLVAVGDSLTHGFQHFAIFNTAWSWPAMIARQLGIDFAYPDYAGGPGGHPLNLEFVARKFNGNLIRELFEIYDYMRKVKVFYTTPPGGDFPNPQGTCNENLAIWGWDLRDVLMRTADTERALIGSAGSGLLPMVNASGHRAAVSVLNSARKPSGVALTPLEAARQLGDEPGGIETLCVWLGANNVLGSVVQLKAVLSGPAYQDLNAKSNYTVWTVPDFTAELTLVADEVRAIKADHVLWGTVPHVTIPPISHGLKGQLAECDRYFNYYGRVWDTNDSFDPAVEPHLTGFQAWAIDIIIDGYNTALQTIVEQARARDKLDWRIVDMCAVLDRLAYRRNVELHARPAEFPEYPLPPALAGLDTRFFTTDNTGHISSGGLIGLDGIHPTTAGYGLVAKEFIDVMVQAGVQFANGSQLDFVQIRQADTLLTAPPPRINDTLGLIHRLNHDIDLVKRLDPFR